MTTLDNRRSLCMQTPTDGKRFMASYFVDAVSLLLILLFIYAATSKLLDHQKFRIQLGQSPMLTAFADIFVWTIPFIEIITACMLALGRTRMLGLFASFSLMTIFSTYIILITRFSEYTPCSCGGVLEKLNWNAHLLINIVFWLLALLAIWFIPLAGPMKK